MPALLFFVAAIAACLLWSAACTAAAARAERPWFRRLLAVVAVAVPVGGLLPWLIVTAGLTWSIRVETNWFGPTLTATLAALVGGLWILRAGLSERDGVPAITWPLLGLVAAFLAAKCLAAGMLIVMDHAVTSMARFQRVEAASLMQAALPPLASPADDAAPLYLQAFAIIESAPSLKGVESLLAKPPHEVDATSDEATALLARHAAAIDLLRRAADRPGCRFLRDWTRPSIDMLLPEVQGMRQAARLLALAIRREAADGRRTDALRDSERLHRIGMHVAGEPILVSGLVGQTIDTTAIDCLADVLPRLTKADLPAIDAPGFRDFVGTPISFARNFLGEEALGLTTFADLMDSRNATIVSGLTAAEGGSLPAVFEYSAPFIRIFAMPADAAGYRDFVTRFQALAAPLPSRPYPEIAAQAAAIESDLLRERRPGLFTSLLAPALGGVLRSQAVGQARHRAAEIAVAATRQRLESGALPESLDQLTPRFIAAVPRDPFTTDATLLLKKTEASWKVYSVGPDGEDDGGPPALGTEKTDGNDDVGLRLSL